MGSAKTLFPFLKVWLGSASDAEELYERWDFADARFELTGFTLIYTHRGSSNLAAPARVDLATNAYLRSFLTGDHAVFLDEKIRRRMNILGASSIPVDYTVSFDTQFITYVSDLLQGRTTNMESAVRRVLDYVVAHRLNWDVLVFCHENMERLTRDGVAKSFRLRNNLFASEVLKDLDEDHYLQTGEVRAHVPEEELWERVDSTVMFYEGRDNQEEDWRLVFQKAMYLVLLKVAEIEFTHRRKDLGAKIKALLRFFQEELGTMFLRELVIATHFFERGTDLRFFSKVQKGRKGLLETLNNMAWDLQITRTQELVMCSYIEKGIYLLPYFLTFDRGLVEVLDLYPVTACLFGPDGQYAPYTPLDIRAFLLARVSAPEKWPLRFFSAEARADRDAVRESRQTNQQNLIACLEETLLNVSASSTRAVGRW